MLPRPSPSDSLATSRGSSIDSHFPFVPHLRASANLLSAASSSAYGFLLQASQASDVGSIPIARSINLVDSVALTPGNDRKLLFKWSILVHRCSKIFSSCCKGFGANKVLGLTTDEKRSEKPSFCDRRDFAADLERKPVEIQALRLGFATSRNTKRAKPTKTTARRANR